MGPEEGDVNGGQGSGNRARAKGGSPSLLHGRGAGAGAVLVVRVRDGKRGAEGRLDLEDKPSKGGCLRLVHDGEDKVGSRWPPP